MSRLPTKYLVRTRLDQWEAIQAVAEAANVQYNAFELTQTCAELGTPATVEFPQTGISMRHGHSRRDVSGTQFILSARKSDPWYDFKAAITIEADGLSWETSIDLMERSLWFTPLALEALIDRLLGYKEESSELLHAQELLEQERTKMRSLEGVVTELQRELEVAREALLTAEASPKRSRLLVISALLELLKDPVHYARPNGSPQSAVISSILDRFPLHGLSKRNLEGVFAEANKTRKEIE